MDYCAKAILSKQIKFYLLTMGGGGVYAVITNSHTSRAAYVADDNE